MSKLKALEADLKQGRISRREFLARASALGISATLAGSLLSGTALAATPKRGGRLRVAMTGGGTSDVMDPAQTLDSYMINVSMGQLRNCLTEISGEGKLIGELAQSWEASPDARTWSFNLRTGVEFHNGKTMDSEDVIHSVNHHRNEESKSAAKGLVEAITDIKADGKNAVVFTLSGGNADFPYIMSDYHLVIVPAGTTGQEFEKGIGTGGYALQEWEPGVRTLAKRNPNYWKEGAAWFDEVETLQIADVAARTNALRTGQVDVMAQCDLKTVHLLKKVQGMKVLQTNGTKHMTLPMDCRKAPFDNNDVRLALKHAIDREVWLKTILRGYGVLGNDHPIGEANQYYAAGIPQRTYDIDKAKFHLKKAGMSKLTVNLHTAETAFAGAIDGAVLFREQAAPAGIDIEVVREPDDGYWSNVWMKKPWTASYWGGRPTEDWMFSQVYSEGANWNETFWSNERFNKLLVQGRAELDDGKRREIYAEMQRICRDDGGAVIPLFSAYVQAHSSKVQMPAKVAANWELDGHRQSERWWFA
jgi:peptide/nickel transport system substrate-binding protein